MKRLGIALAIITLAWLPYLLGAFATWPAGSGFESTPQGSDSVSIVDDKIRELKENIRNRMQVEHFFGTSVGTDDNGRHREGSAVAWDANPCPTANVTGDPGTGATAYGADDDGRICRDSTTGELKMWTGIAYVTVPTATSGDGSNHFNLLSGVQFQKAGTDAMDIHAHASRHVTGGADRIKRLIESLTQTTASAGAVLNTAITSQNFIVNAIESTSVDFSGRGGSTTQVLVYWGVDFDNNTGGACQVQARLYIKNATGGLVSAATAQGQLLTGSSGNATNPDSFFLGDLINIGSLGSSTWNFAIHASDSPDDGCFVVGGRLMIFDLGTE